MRCERIDFLLVTVLLCSVPTLAFANGIVHCDNPLGQSDMSICAAREADKADRELDAVWQEVKKNVQIHDEFVLEDQKNIKSHAQALVNSQRAWMNFRKAECDWEGYEFHGGTAEGMAIALCWARITKERISNFKSYLEQQKQK